jgi:hypothetical protein
LWFWNVIVFFSDRIKLLDDENCIFPVCAFVLVFCVVFFVLFGLLPVLCSMLPVYLDCPLSIALFGFLNCLFVNITYTYLWIFLINFSSFRLQIHNFYILVCFENIWDKVITYLIVPRENDWKRLIFVILSNRLQILRVNSFHCFYFLENRYFSSSLPCFILFY